MARRVKRTDDRQVEIDPNLNLIEAVRQMRRESESAREERMRKNAMNQQAFMGEQDWSHKNPGQSQEFLPMQPMAVEIFSAFIKRALIDFGKWFEIQLPKEKGMPQMLLKDRDATELLMCILHQMKRVQDGELKDFPTMIADGVKSGLLTSLVIFKVHGRRFESRGMSLERGTELIDVALPGGGSGKVARPTTRLKESNGQVWRLLIDLIRPEDYYPDPTGRRLYEIHRVERDLFELEAMAEEGIYDSAAVAAIKTDMKKREDELLRLSRRGQLKEQTPSFRKKVVVDEFWGNLLDSEGKIHKPNVLLTIANDQHIIRKPEENPFWHKQSPFVAGPILRVPFTVWHKALADHGTPLNLLANELFNLMVDGGLASVWGVRQVRKDWMEDPSMVSGGIAQGATIPVNEKVPLDGKVVEKVTTGEVPQEAMAMFNLADRMHQAAMLTNDIKLGLLPEKSVKATEVLEASQNQNVLLDGIIRDFENTIMEPLLYRAWMNVLQEYDDLESEDLLQTIGRKKMLMLARMSPEERFLAFGFGCKLKVRGMSSLLARGREFQKLMAFLQFVAGNPVLLQAFFKRTSPDKILDAAYKFINLNPDQFELSEEERAMVAGRMRELPFFMNLANQGRRPAEGGGAGVTGEDQSNNREIDQLSNPLTGITGGAA